MSVFNHLSNIIGGDNRSKVNNASLFPYRAIARLDITKNDGTKTYASGALIGDRLLATAGHCIVQNGERIKSVTLEFGRNGSSVYYTTSDIETYILRGDYATNPTFEGDYAFIVLKKGISNITGHFGIQSAISVGDTIYTAGYPQDKGGKDMYLAQGTVLNVETDRVYYDADTVGGQSGSPVFVVNGGKINVVAIHTHGTYTPDAVGASNGGRRIEAGLYNWLKSMSYVD